MYLPAAVQWRARCEVYITHCGIFSPSNLPETEKICASPAARLARIAAGMGVSPK